MGNREFAVAKKTIEKAVEEMKMPEANVFMDEFLDSFSLTLDELRDNK